MNSYFNNETYLIALFITLVFEAPIVWLAYRKIAPSLKLILAVFLFTNLFTHGTFWSTFDYVPVTYVYKVILFEIIICLVEAVVYRGFLKGGIFRALLASISANVTSVVAGLLFWSITL